MSHLHATDSPDLDNKSRFQIAVMVDLAARLTEDGHRISYHEAEVFDNVGLAVKPHVELNRRHSSIFFSCASNKSDEISACVFIIGQTGRTEGVRFKISDPDLYDKISEYVTKH